VVGSGIQVFLVENDIFGWVCLQDACFLKKGRNKPEQVQSNIRLYRRGTGTSTAVKIL